MGALTSLKDLIDGAEDRWGKTEDNVGQLVPFGIAPVDTRLYGVPIDRGGIFGIQGVPGSRKTTLIANIIVNQCLSRRLPVGYSIAIDTLESGMTIERYADILLSILATKFIVYWHWRGTNERDILKLLAMGLPSIPGEDMIEQTGTIMNDRFIRETTLSPETFKYRRMTKRQMEAIDMAKAIARTWPVFIFGSSENSDMEVSKQMSTETTNLERASRRWFYLTEHYNVRELVIDHMQEYVWAEKQTDFDVMRSVVSMVAQWQKSCRGVAWIISQIGVTSERESRREKISAYAQGGRGLEAESQLIWQVNYDTENPYQMILKRPIKSRLGMHPDLVIPLDPISGAFLGTAQERGHLND